jgi:hypothetical protein
VHIFGTLECGEHFLMLALFLTLLLNHTFLCFRVCWWDSATGGADSDVAASDPGTPAEDKESGQAFGGGKSLIGQCARHLAVPDIQAS